jgi:hypothetical protein
MNQEQMFAIKCAYADLQGSLEDFMKGNHDSFHDWDAHLITIQGLETTFPELNQKPYTVEVCFTFKQNYRINALNQEEAFKEAEVLGKRTIATKETRGEVRLSAMYEVPNA